MSSKSIDLAVQGMSSKSIDISKSVDILKEQVAFLLQKHNSNRNQVIVLLLFRAIMCP
jgi:hypothetical protein